MISPSSTAMRHLFITATDTDAGKTFVTCGLHRALCEAGERVRALKPVACGHEGDGISPDVAALLQAQGMAPAQQAEINRYDFAAPLAPSQAAALEGGRIDETALLDWCRGHMQGTARCLFEGVGGLMVPLDERFLVSDWLAAMPDCQVLLVVRARLGGINHALLTLDRLHAMGRAPRWIVINDADGVGDAMVDRHVIALAPYLDADSRLYPLSHVDTAGYAAGKAMAELMRSVVAADGDE
ncbi:MAG TPA: dethiobiotin synthase [Mariprofundaceae bacterium]|nr:dethiobiotin synthase [Mariprofundaceae bacterium]